MILLGPVDISASCVRYSYQQSEKQPAAVFPFSHFDMYLIAMLDLHLGKATMLLIRAYMRLDINPFLWAFNITFVILGNYIFIHLDPLTF